MLLPALPHPSAPRFAERPPDSGIESPQISPPASTPALHGVTPVNDAGPPSLPAEDEPEEHPAAMLQRKTPASVARTGSIRIAFDARPWRLPAQASA